jgi:hypothetical protein
LPQNIPNGIEIDQVGKQFTNLFLARQTEIYPNRDFWFKNIPSGTPGLQEALQAGTYYLCR